MPPAGVLSEMPCGYRKTPVTREMHQNPGIENVQKIEIVVCRASWRNFILANFAGRSFSTATPDFASYH
jgi:hypothetical protein